MTTTIAKFAHLQIPLEDVVKATDNFHDDNIIGRGGLGRVYKGQLQRSGELITISALRLDRKHGGGVVQFWTEVSMLSDLKHPNIVSLIGFCEEKDEKIIITAYAAKGSLQEHLNSPNLTWTQILKICVGVARALSYLHYDERRGYGVIHLNINSSTILLNKNWKPKLSGFKVSIRQLLNRMDRVTLSEPIGTIGYMDPEIEKTKGVTHKSDVYAFGVVLFEMLCGRRAYIMNGDNRFLAPLAKHHYENNTLKDIIHPDLWNQISSQSLLKYSEAAYSCLKEERRDRPNINYIVAELEDALRLQLRLENIEEQIKQPDEEQIVDELEKALKLQFTDKNLEDRIQRSNTDQDVNKLEKFQLTSEVHGKKLEGLKIPLSDIKLATDSFSKTYKIGSCDDYILYRAELSHFDKENNTYEEGKNKDEHPKGQSIVVIKRYSSGHERYGEEHFLTEIEMLRSVKHPNIVTLLGFCVEDSEMILVIDNVSNGYLARFLRNVNDRRFLTWEKRLKICIDVAHALNYLHSQIEDQKIIINRNIKSDNIGLDENQGAKISDFGLSVFLPPNQEDEALYPKMISGTYSYMDPIYEKSGTLKRESDVYSFGVVLFEILCGRVAYDQIYKKESDKGLASVATQRICMGTLEEMIDPIIKEEISENNFLLNRGPNKDSLHTFIQIASQCVEETQARRPTMKVVVKELEKALFFQKNNKDNPRIPLEDVKRATQNFYKDNCIGQGGFGKVYKGILEDGEGFQTIVAKRLETRFGQGEQQFLSELQVLLEYKHENIIGLKGYCDENDEKIVVYEYTPKGSLDRYLNDVSLTWMKRLNICIDVASALDFLHGGVGRQAKVIHRDIKTANILLNHDGKAKLADFSLSLISPINQELDYVIDRACGTQGYVDPLYINSGFLTIGSDIYSFGVVLFEILYGKSTFAFRKYAGHYLPEFIKNKFNEGKHEEVVFKKIKEQIVPKSLSTFQEIAYQCLHHESDKRPTTKQVLTELKRALGFQIHREVAHLAIRLEEILSATNHFGDENLIKEGGFGKDYMGQMPRSGQLIDICARRLKHKHGHRDIEFWTEISMLSSLEHKNIISFVGFCDENDEKIIIYEHAVHGSLDQHLSDPNLTWFQRLQICLGVARALSYIHYDVIHCDINSSKIFLDKDWEPKIYGFELSTKYPQSWSHRLLCSSYFDNPIMTPKYDVYSFGVLLFEVVCGKKPIIGDNGVKEELTIDQNLRKQMDTHSLALFTKTTYNCLNQQPVQRPTMDQIVKELEDMFELQWKHENLEHSTAAEATSINHLKMDLLKIPLSEIRLATNNFDEAYSIGFGGFGVVYKATLEVLDIPNLSSVELEGKCKDELPKRSKTVAIKRIIDNEQGKQGFLTEIDLLTSCKHPNIVSLLGFSNEGREMILVYEYAFKGSLNDYFGNTSKINLTWTQKIQICIDIARGISYLHTNMEGKPRIIHRDIKSDNILLDENLNAKVADFGLSKFHPMAQQASTVYTKNIAGTEVYLDPEYLTTGKYKKESDVYSFGVVLFEIICGRPAYDSIYMGQHLKGLAPVARRRFTEGTLKELIDPKMIEEDDKNMFTLNRGPNQDSFEMFSRIAYQCLAETQAKRPTMEAVIKELHNALKLQGEAMVLSRFRLSDILSATKSFSDIYCIGLHEYGVVYQAELDDFENKGLLAFEENKGPKTRINVAIKRIYSSGDVRQRFFSEIEMRTRYKHPNVVSLLGFCYEGDETILVYEYTSNKSLDDYLKNVNNMDNLTWTQRLHLCLGIARGLNHLHTKMDNQEMIIHGDIKSANILLGRNWEPKIAYFGISKFDFSNQESSTLINTKVYWDPKFEKTPIMKKKYDIYSFGVILFEIFCGRLAYDSIYIDKNEKGLTSVVRSHFNNGTIKELLDHKLKEVTDEDIFYSNRGPNQDSLDMFLKIAYQCLEETQANRPTTEIIIKELEMALDIQENQIKNLELSHKDIALATDQFSQKNYFGSGRYWHAYKGEIQHANANAAIVAKRWDSYPTALLDDQFRTELDILFKRKHKNIIRLVGYCNEMNEKIIVYEHMSKGSLEKYLKDSKLTWITRLQICIDVASALEFLHGGDVTLKKVVHRDIKSHGILLNENWDAKISNFELSSLESSHQDMEQIGNDAYRDPQYRRGFLNEKSDIYSFGVVLLEILCGSLAWVQGHEGYSQSLVTLAKHYYEQGKLGEMVFEDIRKEIVPESLTIFADIAYQCLDEDGYMRPKARDMVIQLKKALESQEDFEIWEPKLPSDYKEIIRLSETPDIKEIKDIYKKLSNGILLPKEKVWYKLSDNGEANKMISATAAKFSSNNHKSHTFRSIHISRFQKVAKMLDISNLKIQVTIDNRFLSTDVIYRVYLVFKFSGPIIFTRKRMYMNLKYKNGNGTFHSYFATRRDEEWMMIELHRFLNHKEDVSFTFLLESFSRYYCPSGAIFIEGIEFRAIKNMAHEDDKNRKKVQEVQKSNSDLDQVLTVNEKMFLRVSDEKKHLMLSATEVLYNSKKWELFLPKSSADSRFQNVMELRPKQVIRIKYKIDAQVLSPFTEYTCYLVYKVSEKCQGLHCPVKVRNLLRRKNKENQIIYFRTPSHLNHHDDFWVPKQRKDGWMEVMIWKFNSKYNNNLGKDVIPMNLKLVTYEGTMSGLIICGLEFRPT